MRAELLQIGDKRIAFGKLAFVGAEIAGDRQGPPLPKHGAMGALGDTDVTGCHAGFL